MQFEGGAGGEVSAASAYHHFLPPSVRPWGATVLSRPVGALGLPALGQGAVAGLSGTLRVRPAGQPIRLERPGGVVDPAPTPAVRRRYSFEPAPPRQPVAHQQLQARWSGGFSSTAWSPTAAGASTERTVVLLQPPHARAAVATTSSSVAEGTRRGQPPIVAHYPAQEAEVQAEAREKPSNPGAPDDDSDDDTCFASGPGQTVKSAVPTGFSATASPDSDIPRGRIAEKEDAAENQQHQQHQEGEYLTPVLQGNTTDANFAAVGRTAGTVTRPSRYRGWYNVRPDDGIASNCKLVPGNCSTHWRLQHDQREGTSETAMSLAAELGSEIELQRKRRKRRRLDGQVAPSNFPPGRHSKKMPWSVEDTNKLQQIVADITQPHDTNAASNGWPTSSLDWAEVAKRFNNGRSAEACRLRYTRLGRKANRKSQQSSVPVTEQPAAAAAVTTQSSGGSSRSQPVAEEREEEPHRQNQQRRTQRRRQSSAHEESDQEDEEQPSQIRHLSRRTRSESDYEGQGYEEGQQCAEPARRRSSRAVKQVENPDFIDITLPCLSFGHRARGSQAMAFRKDQLAARTTQADRQEAAMLYIGRRQQKRCPKADAGTFVDNQHQSQPSRRRRSSSFSGSSICEHGSSDYNGKATGNHCGSASNLANDNGSSASPQVAIPDARRKRKTEPKRRRQPTPRTLWVRPTKPKANLRTTRSSRADKHSGRAAAAAAEAAAALTNRELEASSPLATSRDGKDVRKGDRVQVKFTNSSHIGTVIKIGVPVGLLCGRAGDYSDHQYGFVAEFSRTNADAESHTINPALHDFNILRKLQVSVSEGAVSGGGGGGGKRAYDSSTKGQSPAHSSRQGRLARRGSQQSHRKRAAASGMLQTSEEAVRQNLACACCLEAPHEADEVS